MTDAAPPGVPPLLAPDGQPLNMGKLKEGLAKIVARPLERRRVGGQPVDYSLKVIEELWAPSWNVLGFSMIVHSCEETGMRYDAVMDLRGTLDSVLWFHPARIVVDWNQHESNIRQCLELLIDPKLGSPKQPSFIEDFLRNCETMDRDQLDIIWSLLCYVQGLNRILQHSALRFKSSLFLERMLATGRYAHVINSMWSIFNVGNTASVDQLLSEGFSIEITNGSGETPLYSQRTREMILYFIKKGADINKVLLPKVPPHPSVLRWICEYQPAFASQLSASYLFGALNHLPKYAELARDFRLWGGSQLPDSFWVGASDRPEVVAALYSFGYDVPQDALCNATKFPRLFRWSLRTHRFCSKELCDAVFCALCVFKRLCSLMPHDVRKLLCETAFTPAADKMDSY